MSVLERIAAGDRTAVAECIDKYGGLVWSLAQRLSAGRADAEDAVQEIFIDLWGNAHRFDVGRGSEATFIATIARRRLIDRMRKEQRRPRTEELSAAFVVKDPTQIDPVVRDEAARAQRVLATLKPEQQRVLCMAIYRGFTHREIAELLGLPLGTVKTHVRRGLIAIRERMLDDGPSGRAGVKP